jgi:pyruvate dehydrogenase E2 component (dihydrolipoamide acetyltransferase)
MATEVILPMLGETMNEGTIVAWFKLEGQAVNGGDVLYSVESDKATLEVEAPAAGYLRRILAPAGSTVPVLSVVALITATPDEVVSAPASQSAAASLPAAHERGIGLNLVHGSGPGGRIVERDVLSFAPAAASTATPIAVRRARDLGVDLTRLQGTGPGGRVTRQDVERAAQARPTSTAGAVEPLSRAHRLMAERMVTSFTSAPHFYLHAEVNARRLLALRRELLPALEASAGIRVTITDILVRLVALALVKHPRAMAQYTPEGLRLAPAVNIGVAADTPKGLVVPVIRDAAALGLAEIARKRSELIERARAGKSLPSDFEAGVFTLTNLGTFRVDSFDAIVNPPQAAVLAVGRIVERPFVEDGQLRAVPTARLSLSVDHRVLDGAGAAGFLDDIVALVEAPALALA